MRTRAVPCGALTRRVRCSLLASLVAAGCLENLHQEKWFAKLRAADPVLFERVTRCRAEIERDLDAAISGRVSRDIEHVGHFGESWGYVNTVTEDGVLFMRGRVRFGEGRAASYAAAFRVDEACALEIAKLEVFE